MYNKAPFIIEPFSEEGFTDEQDGLVADRIESILESWENTPYAPGASIKQRGVDCVHFVTCVFDELLGRTTTIPILPQDLAFHNKEKSIEGFRTFLRAYKSVPVNGMVIQPGDVLVCGPVNGGPGHGVIAGKKSLWHCNTRRVSKCGLWPAVSKGMYMVKKIYRSQERKSWLWQQES